MQPQCVGSLDSESESCPGTPRHTARTLAPVVFEVKTLWCGEHHRQHRQLDMWPGGARGRACDPATKDESVYLLSIAVWYCTVILFSWISCELLLLAADPVWISINLFFLAWKHRNWRNATSLMCFPAELHQLQCFNSLCSCCYDSIRAAVALSLGLFTSFNSVQLSFS